MEEYLAELLQSYPLIAPLLFTVARAVPVVFAPIPGLAFDIVGVALFGWKLGLLLALVGAHIGATVAFFIGRWFREPAVARFVSLRSVHAWEETYSETQKFWILVAVRLITSPFFDYVSYAAGLTKMGYARFIASTFIGIFPFAFAIYYFGGLALYQGPLYALALFIGLATLAGVFRGKIKRWIQRRSD